jgi:histidine triad (HIT) family protein
VSCVFCGIAAGNIPAAIVFEDDEQVAFLDTRPLFHGHTLLIPREHIETLEEMPTSAAGALFQRMQMIAAGVQKGCGAQGTFIALNNKVSQSVPHLHVHIVPRTKGDGLKGFFWPRKKYESEEQMNEVADRIRAALK